MRRKEEEDKKGGINTVQAVPKALQAESTRTAPRERGADGTLRLSSEISLSGREILMGSDMSYTCTITPRMAFLGGGGRCPYLFFLGANFLACFGSWYL